VAAPIATICWVVKDALLAPDYRDGIHGWRNVLDYVRRFRVPLCKAIKLLFALLYQIFRILVLCPEQFQCVVCINQPHKNPPSSASLSATV
jgi:hypothetical protein